MKYAQVHRRNKLHLVFEADGYISNPICGVKVNKYRMTINVPLAHSCRNCQRVYAANGGQKVRRQFFDSLLKQSMEE